MAKEQKKELLVDPYSIIRYPLLSEKSLSKVDTENKIVFIVGRQTTKKQVKWAVEKAFETKVDRVNTLIDRQGRKKAIVTLNKSVSAADIAMKLGMM